MYCLISRLNTYRKRMRVIFTRVSDLSPTLLADFVDAAAGGGGAFLATFGASGAFGAFNDCKILSSQHTLKQETLL